MAQTLRAGIYARVSMDRSGEGLAVSRQVEDARDLADRRGWQITAERIDNDLSAAGKTRRPAFDDLLALIDTGALDVVVAWSLDRLTRNRRDTVRLIEACQARGVLIALVRGSDLDMGTPSGRLVADVLASVARAEIEVKGDRQRRAVEQAVAEGRRVGGRRAFGFELDMTPRADEADALREAYTMLLQGASLGAIARMWNARGHRTPQHGNEWEADVIRRVLLKATNAGLRSHRGVVAGAANWQGVVEVTTWEAACALLTDPGRRTSPGGARRLLTGLALCGVCGEPVNAGGTRPGIAPTYRCSTGRHISRGRAEVDRFVETVTLELLKSADAAEVFAPDAPDLGPLLAEADALRARRRALADNLDLDEITLARRSRAITARLDEIATAVTTAGRTSAVADLIAADDVDARWASLDVEGRRLIIGALMTIRLLPPGRGTRTFRAESVVIEPKRSPKPSDPAGTMSTWRS